MARESSMADRREYVRVAVGLPMNPKLGIIDEPAASWLYVVSLCYCGEYLTDGVFVPAMVSRTAGVDKEMGKRLISVGLWHEAGHDCPKCPQPPEGHLVVHDYLMHQRSRDQAEQVRTAGQTAAKARWAKRDANRMRTASQQDAGSGSDAEPNADGMRTAYESQCDSDADPNAEVEVEVEVEVEEDREGRSPTAGGVGGEASQQAAPSAKTPRSDRGSRITEDWVPSEHTRSRLRTEYQNLNDEWWRRTHERFVNHWFAKTGRDSRKLDWDRTFSNWVHEQVDRDRPRGAIRPGGLAGTAPSKGDAAFAESQERFAAMKAAKIPPADPGGQDLLEIEGVRK